MTARQLFEYSLLELNKVQAPSLLLEDYNYFINKAVNQYINRMYNAYDVNQQKTDDLRVLKSTAVLTPALATDYTGMALFSAVYEANLPDDYLHLLNCVVEYNALKAFKCYNLNDKVHFGARRLTADMFSQIINNYYMRPSYKVPYYFINNITTPPIVFPTTDSLEDINFIPATAGIERESPERYGNKSHVRLEVRYGKDNTLFELARVYIDYLKAPQFIRLTQSQVDLVEDTSQLLEFPDYVNQEIVNELIKLLLENSSDPRIQSHIPVNQSIANPAQEQEPQRKK